MRSRSLLGTVLALGACAGGSLTTNLTATPSAGPADAIECTRSTLTKRGYQVSAFDQTGHRLVVRQVNDSVSRPEPQFRRLVDRIETEAAPGADGKTKLKITGHTVAEYMTHRGPTEVEEKASKGVTEAAQSVVQACGQA